MRASISPPPRIRLHAGLLLSLAFAWQAAGTRMASGASLVFSGLIGGGRGWSEDAVHEVASDRTGHLYVVGETEADDFPVSQDRTYGSPESGQRAFVAKLSPDGSTLLYVTLLAGASGRSLRWTATAGGAGRDNLTTLATGPGSLLLLAAGQSNSETLPGARSTQLGPGGGSDAWVLAVNPATGAALWTVRMGGSSTERVAALAVAPDGSIGMLCEAASGDLPTTPGAFRSVAFEDGDAWLVRLASDGTGLTAATHLPGRVGIPLGWLFNDTRTRRQGLPWTRPGVGWSDCTAPRWCSAG